jgi:DNA-binding transcriptional regulator YiaG
MTFGQLRKRFGTQSDIARALNVSRSLVSYWKFNGISEARRAWLREQLTIINARTR